MVAAYNTSNIVIVDTETETREECRCGVKRQNRVVGGHSAEVIRTVGIVVI